MLLVKTKIGSSKIDGIGLFADQFIPKGTPIWKYQEGFDLEINKSELDKLSESSRSQFLKYAYRNPEIDKYILCFDDARFWNHSENPNCQDTYPSGEKEGIDTALRDIQKGEELTIDYKNFDADYDFKMSTY
jgi:hypothetical protein